MSYLFNRFLLRAFSVPGIVLGSGNKTVEKSPRSLVAYIQVKIIGNKNQSVKYNVSSAQPGGIR